MRHARGRKLESGVQKNRSIKPKIRWKAKGLPDVWQGQHQVLEVQQALIFPTSQYVSRRRFAGKFDIFGAVRGPRKCSVLLRKEHTRNKSGK